MYQKYIDLIQSAAVRVPAVSAPQGYKKYVGSDPHCYLGEGIRVYCETFAVAVFGLFGDEDLEDYLMHSVDQHLFIHVPHRPIASILGNDLSHTVHQLRVNIDGQKVYFQWTERPEKVG